MISNETVERKIFQLNRRLFVAEQQLETVLEKFDFNSLERKRILHKRINSLRIIINHLEDFLNGLV